mgnify:CR=1 FL=1
MTYDDVEYILAEIITEATGEPRVGRFERTLAKTALKRLRDVGMTLSPAVQDHTIGGGER